MITFKLKTQNDTEIAKTKNEIKGKKQLISVTIIIKLIYIFCL